MSNPRPLTPTEHAYALARLLDAPLEWQRYQAWQDSLGANTSEHEANAERTPSEHNPLQAKAERIYTCAVCGYTARTQNALNGHGVAHPKGKQ